ncbi:MAG: hypothetical protein V4731_01040 [Pseudomonadota bacterium]
MLTGKVRDVHGSKLLHLPFLPAPLLALTAVYFVASLAHFVHNAEYIALYPGISGWLSRETIYLAWAAVTSLGLGALLLARSALRTAALVCLGAYGAFGLDGLAHYTLALCSEHTLAANLTIAFEAVTGLILLLACAVLCVRRMRPRLAP